MLHPDLGDYAGSFERNSQVIPFGESLCIDEHCGSLRFFSFRS